MNRLPILDRPPSHPRSVLLVDLPWSRDKDPRVPLGHASMLASLRAAGIEAVSVVAPVNALGVDLDSLWDRLRSAVARLPVGPRLVGVGAYVWNEHLVQPLLRRLATLPETRVVVGGPQVSFSTSLDGLYPTADCLVRGAGEDVIVELAGCAAGAEVPGVVWRGGRDQGSQARVDLEKTPSPFLTGVVPLSRGFVRWETKRGCVFKCSFCQHRNPDGREYQRLGEGRLRREIQLFARAGVRDVAVLDPIFNDGARAVRTLEACRDAGLEARLSLQARLEMTDAEFLAATRGLRVRLEFGLQTIHRAEFEAVKRPNNLRRAEKNLEAIRRSGHPFEISLIYGLPNQTLDSFIGSVRWCLDQGVPTIKAFPLMLLRGTELAAERARWGLVEDDALIPQVVASDTFGPEQHARMAAISQALRATEGAHPSLRSLLELADRLAIDPDRFSPAA